MPMSDGSFMHADSSLMQGIDPLLLSIELENHEVL